MQSVSNPYLVILKILHFYSDSKNYQRLKSTIVTLVEEFDKWIPTYMTPSGITQCLQINIKYTAFYVLCNQKLSFAVQKLVAKLYEFDTIKDDLFQGVQYFIYSNHFKEVSITLMVLYDGGLLKLIKHKFVLGL